MKTVVDHHSTFALTCPLLLTEEQRINPYLFLEEFFNYTSLGGYRAELSVWFKNVLSEAIVYERVSTLLFIHNQFLQLIQAGYVIASTGMRYSPLPIENGELFCHWLVGLGYIKEKDHVEHHDYNNPYWLSVPCREAPLTYIQETLTLETVTHIRKGLKEWLEAGSSEYDCIADLKHEYAFELYELLQKIIEACYLLITEPLQLNKEAL